MTKEQIKHNAAVDADIKKSEEEYLAYLNDLAEQKKEFIKTHPDFPYIDSMFIPVIGKRFVAAIKYID